jgi:hypothetical protein
MGYTTSQGAYKLQVNGTIYASGSIIGNITGNVTGTVTTSSNVAGGTAGQLVYQSAPGITGFAGPGTSGQLLVSAGTGAPTYTNTASISVGYAANVLAGAAGSIHYQTAANATGMLAIGTAGQFLSVNAGATAPQWTTTSTAQIGYAANILAGTTGQLHYQSAANTTGFVGPGTANQILVSAGASAPVYTNTGSIQVGYSANILAGTTGQLVYQSAANTTAFVGPGTAGQFLQSAGAGAPTYVSTGTMYVQRAVQADSAVGGAGSVANALTISTGLTGSPSSTYNGSAAITLTLNTASLMASSMNIYGGTTGQLHYQSAANTTGFVGPGTAGQLLVSAGASAPVYTNTTSIQVGYAANDLGGAAGSVRYQSGANASTFLSIGTAGQFLTVNAGATAPQWTTTSTAQIGYAANILAGTTGQLVYQSAANTTGFVGPGTAGQFLQSAGAGAPTYVGTTTMYVQRAVLADSVTGSAGSLANALTIGAGLSGTSGTYNGSAAVTVSLNTASLMASSMNIYGGTTGQLHYQSAANTTAFVGPGTANQILVSAGASAPVYTNTGSIQVGYAANDLGGAAGSVRYQSGANASTFLSIGTAGQILSVNAGATAPQWTTTSTAQIGYTANILGGAGGSIVYQTAANATGMLAIGTNGYVLTSNGSAPVWTIASSVTSGNATNAANIATVIQTANANYFPTFVSANNATSANMAVFTTSSFYINPSTGATVHSGSVLATGGLYSGATSGATRALLSSNGDLNSFYAAESTARIQLGRDVGVSGGAGLALGGSSYALISASDTAGAILYFKLSASTGTASSSPNMTLNSTGLGIGTTGVGAPLSFVDATGLKIQLNANAANYYAIEKQAAINGGDGMFKYNAGQTSAGEHGFYSGNALKLLIDASGNAIHAQGSNIVIRGSSTASSEGAQIVLGYGNNTSSAITGQANYTWNIDVASGLANNNFRIFRQNSAGVTVIGAEFTEATGGVQLISVGVGTTSTGVTGELRATNEITAYFGSDARLKENVKLIDDPITLINQIRGVYFDWTDEHINRRGGEDGYFVRKHDIGVIAQEIEAVLPEIVATRDDGFKAVRYEKIVPLLIESIKAQQKQITQLQTLVDQLVNK